MSGQIARLVITSVPRGLDGGGGIQPVLRPAEMPPAVSRRLCDLATYSHPCSGGDPRNPAVFQHRIETISGRRMHLLAGIRDTGASYTGRSNHLAELLVIDEEDLVNLPAGPAFMARHFPWLTHWEGEPRLEPPMPAAGLSADDPEDSVLTGRAAACPRWKEVTGDTGWAGELAKAFLDGRNAIIEINASHQSIILDLFVEAARLLPVRDRWRVTFNTSELDFFPAAWRARRLDLPLVGPRSKSNDLRLVLDDIHREAWHPDETVFSRFARGEAPAPWHAAAAEANTASTDEHGQTGAGGSVPAEGFADDAMVRERLTRLRERRHRSAGPRIVNTPADDTTRSSGWPLVAIAVATTLAVVLFGILLLASRIPAESHSNARENSFAARLNYHDDLQEATSKESYTKKEDEAAKPKADANKAHATTDHPAREWDDRTSEADTEKQKADETAQVKAAEDQDMAALQQRRRDAFLDLAREETNYVCIEPPPPRSIRSSGTQGSDRWPLCRFDAEHLVGLTLSFASAPARDVKPLQVGARSDEGWPVTTEVRDEFKSEHWRRRTVCHLVTINGQLLLRWPTDREQWVDWKDPVLAMLQNSLLLVCASDPDSQEAKPEPRRTIAFAAPIIPESLALDPLAEKPDVVFKPESELVRRLKAIAPTALHWELELTHPTWDGPQRLASRETLNSLPDLPKAGISITFEDVDPKLGKIVQRQSDLRIKTTVTFAPERATLELASSIAGLDDHSRLGSIDLLYLLRQCRAKKPKPPKDFLTTELRKLLRERPQDYRDRRFEIFLTGTGVHKEFNSLEKLRRKEQDCREKDQILNEIKSRMQTLPGPEFGNNPRNAEWKKVKQEHDDEYKAVSEAISQIRQQISQIESSFDKAYNADQAKEIEAAADSIQNLAMAAEPVTVQILSLWADAIDSTGSKHRVDIVQERAAQDRN